jgi:hypothetical protein
VKWGSTDIDMNLSSGSQAGAEVIRGRGRPSIQGAPSAAPGGRRTKAPSYSAAQIPSFPAPAPSPTDARSPRQIRAGPVLLHRREPTIVLGSAAGDTCPQSPVLLHRGQAKREPDSPPRPLRVQFLVEEGRHWMEEVDGWAR